MPRSCATWSPHSTCVWQWSIAEPAVSTRPSRCSRKRFTTSIPFVPIALGTHSIGPRRDTYTASRYDHSMRPVVARTQRLSHDRCTNGFKTRRLGSPRICYHNWNFCSVNSKSLSACSRLGKAARPRTWRDPRWSFIDNSKIGRRTPWRIGPFWPRRDCCFRWNYCQRQKPPRQRRNICSRLYTN